MTDRLRIELIAVSLAQDAGEPWELCPTYRRLHWLKKARTEYEDSWWKRLREIWERWFT